jgi:hypothetical protein
MPQDEFDDARIQLLRSLITKVEKERYPSTTMLDYIEELLTPEELPRYTRVLMRHIDNDEFPSIPMIDRLKNVSVG